MHVERRELVARAFGVDCMSRGSSGRYWSQKRHVWGAGRGTNRHRRQSASRR